MTFKWESEKEKRLKGTKISPAKKLEGLRLINELADKALTKAKKIIRHKLRTQ